MSNLLSKIRDDEDEFYSAGGKGDDPYTEDPTLVPPAKKESTIAAHQKELEHLQNRIKEIKTAMSEFVFASPSVSVEVKIQQARKFLDIERDLRHRIVRMEKLEGYLAKVRTT